MLEACRCPSGAESHQTNQEAPDQNSFDWSKILGAVDFSKYVRDGVKYKYIVFPSKSRAPNL